MKKDGTSVVSPWEVLWVREGVLLGCGGVILVPLQRDLQVSMAVSHLMWVLRIEL